MTRIITLGLLLAMMLSIASCGKKDHGKVGRKIAPEDPWFDAKTYNIDPGLDTGGKEIEYKQQKLAGADENILLFFRMAIMPNLIIMLIMIRVTTHIILLP